MSQRLLNWLVFVGGIQFIFLEGCVKDFAWTFGPLIV